MNKEFSPEFQRDIADLLVVCMENQTDSITITMHYGKHDLDIDMTFRVYQHEDDEEEEE